MKYVQKRMLTLTWKAEGRHPAEAETNIFRVACAKRTFV
jgi:hypothetical protein